MKLSVVIVNYNVKYFLEQCLYSVKKAVTNIDAEVFVVDNNSVDGSCVMVREKFPDVKIIENKNNTGFSYANNQAIKLSGGEYILLLNPDTVVEEDTFQKIINFADSKDDFGALGVKMIDGKGKLLPESKRGLPTPWVAFCKMTGLSKLFPKSALFNGYYMGYLDHTEINRIDILAGAFMMLKRTVIDEVGLLDEDFFMYGEDIDLSYRIGIGGYSNYYFPDTTIIHYKGESTKKGSLNYVVVFYKAMIIFARKHFSKKNAWLFSFLINLAVYFSAGISIFKRILNTIMMPVIDAAMIFGGYAIIKPYWEAYKFPDGGHYPDEFLFIAVPVYIIIWFSSILFSGGYSKSAKPGNIIKGIGIGTIIILSVYALLSEDMRFSRALIIIGALWALISLFSFRLLLNLINPKKFSIRMGRKKRIVIVGNKEEGIRVHKILKQTDINQTIVGYVGTGKNKLSTGYLGCVEQLEEIVVINKLDEIIFCSKDISIQKIISNMLKLSNIQTEYKIAPPESISVIGSNSISTAGDLYVISLNSIGRRINRVKKRLTDIFTSIILLMLSPGLILFYRKGTSKFFRNIFNVLSGKYSWVGYCINSAVTNFELPSLNPGILSPADKLTGKEISPEEAAQINIRYAKNYKIINDLSIIFSGRGFLSR